MRVYLSCATKYTNKVIKCKYKSLTPGSTSSVCFFNYKYVRF